MFYIDAELFSFFSACFHPKIVAIIITSFKRHAEARIFLRLFFLPSSRQLNLKRRVRVCMPYGIVKCRENMNLFVKNAPRMISACWIYVGFMLHSSVFYAKIYAKDSNFDFIVNKSLSCHFNHSWTISFVFSFLFLLSPELTNKFAVFLGFSLRWNCIHESNLCMQFRSIELNADWMQKALAETWYLFTAVIRDWKPSL